MDGKLEYFKKKILEHLDGLEQKENAEKKELKKSLIAFEMTSIEKAGYPVGTVREWKGKKYIKIAPGKWRPKYDSNSRGAKMSIAALKRKADKCESSEELLQLVLENRDRFSDENGRPLPFVKELSDYVSSLNDKIEGGKTAKKEPKEKPKSKNSEVLKEFSKQYKYLYNHEDERNVAGYSEAIDTFDKMIKENKEFQEYVGKLADERGDFFASDREIAALMFALEQKGDLNKFESPKPKKQFLSEVKDWIVNLAKATGLDIAGFKHKTTGDFERHVIKKHGNEKSEKGRGQVAVTQEDLDNIQSVMDNPDIAVAGIKKNGKDRIVLVKNNEHGSVLVEEVLSGKRNKALNAKTFWILDKTVDEAKIKKILTNTKGYDVSKIKTATPTAATSALSSSQTDEGGRNSTGKGNGLEGDSKESSDTSTIPQNGGKSSGKQTLDAIRDRYQKAKSVTGNRKTIHVGDEKIKCHYKLVEADTPTASHDETTFRKTEGFPTVNGGSVNDNDYENSPEAKESVYRIAGNYDGRAIEDPPILTKDGIVVSGNNRTMSSKLAAKKGTDKEYVKELAETIEDYGIDEDELKNFKNPRLVLEIDEEHKGEYTTEEFAKYNKSGKKEKSVTEKAVVIAKTVKPEAVESIAGKISEFDTLGELYNDRKAAQDLMGTFIQNGLIQENEAAQYYDANGLSANGKEFIETVLVGSVMNESNIRSLAGDGGKALRQKLVRGIVPLIENKGHGNEYSFNNELNKAVEIAAYVSKNHDTFPTIRDYLDQNDMFEEKPSELTQRLAEIVHDSTQKQFAEQMKEAEGGIRPNARGEMDIFLGACESRDSVLERILRYGKNAIKKAVAEALAMIA